MIRVWMAALIVIAVCGMVGCSHSRELPEMEPTFPVTGVIHIDGKPTAGVRVLMFPADDAPVIADANLGAPHAATTDAEGKFAITTYSSGDGAPVGSYILCFYWEGNPKVSLLANADEPQLDRTAVKFNMKHMEPSRSEHKATVTEGQPTDLGVIELTTK